MKIKLMWIRKPVFSLRSHRRLIGTRTQRAFHCCWFHTVFWFMAVLSGLRILKVGLHRGTSPGRAEPLCTLNLKQSPRRNLANLWRQIHPHLQWIEGILLVNTSLRADIPLHQVLMKYWNGRSYFLAKVQRKSLRHIIGKIGKYTQFHKTFGVNKFPSYFPLRNLEWHQVVQSGKLNNSPVSSRKVKFQQNQEAEKHPLPPAMGN